MGAVLFWLVVIFIGAALLKGGISAIISLIGWLIKNFIWVILIILIFSLI